MENAAAIIIILLQVLLGVCEGSNIGRMTVTDFENPHNFTCTTGTDTGIEKLNDQSVTVFYLQFQESTISSIFSLIFQGANYSCAGDEAFSCRLFGINATTGENQYIDPAKYEDYLCHKVITPKSGGRSAIKDVTDDECVKHSEEGSPPYEDMKGTSCNVTNKLYMYNDDGYFGCFTCCKGSWFDYTETKSCLTCSSKFTTPGPGVYPSCSVEVKPVTTTTSATLKTTSTTISTTSTTTTTTPAVTTGSVTSPATPNTTTTTQISTTSAVLSTSVQDHTPIAVKSPEPSISGGGIAAIVVAVIFILVAAVLGVYSYLRKRWCFRDRTNRRDDHRMYNLVPGRQGGDS